MGLDTRKPHCKQRGFRVERLGGYFLPGLAAGLPAGLAAGLAPGLLFMLCTSSQKVMEHVLVHKLILPMIIALSIPLVGQLQNQNTTACALVDTPAEPVSKLLMGSKPFLLSQQFPFRSWAWPISRLIQRCL